MMKKESKQKNKWKIAFIILGVIVLLFVGFITWIIIDSMEPASVTDIRAIYYDFVDEYDLFWDDYSRVISESYKTKLEINNGLSEISRLSLVLENLKKNNSKTIELAESEIYKVNEDDKLILEAYKKCGEGRAETLNKTGSVITNYGAYLNYYALILDYYDNYDKLILLVNEYGITRNKNKLDEAEEKVNLMKGNLNEMKRHIDLNSLDSGIEWADEYIKLLGLFKKSSNVNNEEVLRVGKLYTLFVNSITDEENNWFYQNVEKVSQEAVRLDGIANDACIKGDNQYNLIHAYVVKE
jgi:hypothetical protein